MVCLPEPRREDRPHHQGGVLSKVSGGKGGAQGLGALGCPRPSKPAFPPLPAGCFHVPRCLAMCEEMLSDLLSRLAPAPALALSARSPPADPARRGAE